MSYRSFKRVLGETNLERKCRFLFGACLLTLITGSFWWYSLRTEQQLADVGDQVEKAVSAASRQTGHGLVDAILIMDHWQKSVTGIDLELTEFFDKSLEGPAYKWKIILPDAVDPDTPQDDTDREKFAYFSKMAATMPRSAADAPGDVPSDVEELIARQATRDFKNHLYYYYEPVFIKETCATCHQLRLSASSNPRLEWVAGLKVGDMAAVVKVTVPDAKTQTALRNINEESARGLIRNRAVLVATAIITFFVAMIASYVIVKYVVVKPLKHLRDVSDEISHGATDLRADIHTGDEFEELGLAFNRMVRHLTTIQDELRNVNHSLDGKVDELAQVNMKLYEMNRLKSDFLATMSHELRTPLNAIIGFSDVLGSIDSLDDKQKRYVKNIQTSGRSLLEMINDILDLAKIESGKMDVRLSEFRIEPVVGSLCDMARPLTERKNIDLEFEIEPGLGELLQDQSKVQQILNNLLSNAIKFTPEGGRITVSARRGQRDNLVLQVVDTGVGISDEDQGAIFEKFRQGGAVLSGGDAMTREYSGTGLGLSIVKELCKLLGGEISVESELGKGSTFTVELPWVRPEPARSEDALLTADDVERARRFDLGAAAITPGVGHA